MRHVIILADLKDQSVNEVRQILLDWHLCGLVQKPNWLSLDRGDRFVETLADEGTERVLLSEWLDKYIEVDDELELVALQMHNDAGVYVPASVFHDAIEGFDPLLMAEAKIVNLIAPANIEASVPAEVLMSYRTNLIAIPTQSSSSRSGHIILQPQTSGFFANVAAAVSTASGIWSGQDHNPVRELSYPKTKRPEVMMMRSFVRYADASDLVSVVVKDVVERASSNGLPLAYSATGDRLSALPFQIAKQDVEKVAVNFIAANPAVFDLKKFKEKPKAQTKPLTPMALLKEYGKMLKTYFKPGSFFAERKAEYAGAAALMLQQVFLGSNSTAQVFVDGVSGAPSRKADNSLNAVLDLVNASNSLRKSVVEPAAASPRQLWKDFAATSTALIDGGQGPVGVELPGVAGGDRRVVLFPELIVPKVNSIPFQVPADLDIPLRGEIISADNPYLAAVLRDQLNRVLANAEKLEPIQIGQVQRTKFDLDLWIEDKQSFAWHIGMRLGSQLNAARNIFGVLPADNEEGDQNRLEELSKLEKQAKKAVDRIVLGGLAIVGGAGVFGLLQGLWVLLATAAFPVVAIGSLLVPGLIVAGILFIWNVIGLRRFASAVRDIYKLENQKDRQAEIAKWADEIKDDLANEVKRLGDYYQQYQLWSTLLAKPLHDPLGEPEIVASNDGRIQNLNQITSSIQLAELDHTGETLENLVDHVKKSFFSKGWLDRILTKRLEGLGAAFPNAWLDSGSDDNSPLRVVFNKSQRSDGHKELGEIVVQELQRLATADTDYSVWPLSVLNMPIERKVKCHEFLEPLATGSTVMPNTLLTDIAEVHSLSRVDISKSFVIADSRVNLYSDVAKHLTNPEKVEIARRLDIVNVRVELSKTLHADSITTFASPVAPEAAQRDLTAAPEA